MEYVKALDQISTIHAQLAKTELFRGYRPLPVALTGIVGLLAVWLQPHVVGPGDGVAYCAFWVVVAGLNALIGGGAIVRCYFQDTDSLTRRRTRQVVGQFLPCLLAGVGATLGVFYVDVRYIPLLPGFWAILYGLGLFSSRPYLPRAMGWVALFYLVAGVALLCLAKDGTSL